MPHGPWIELAAYFGSVCALAPWLGKYMAQVFSGEKHVLSWLSPLERWIYRGSGVDPAAEMTWTRYAAALLIFSGLGTAVLLGLQWAQPFLPFNPQRFGRVPLGLAWNTAVSFMTNTNWQNYAGEATLGYLTQMAGLTVQNFLSAASGLAVLLALVRGITRHQAGTVGNFWADLTRAVLYVLLPLSLLWAVLLAGQGVVQSLKPYTPAVTLEGARQTLPLGPAASQVAIKHLGTNGGGFFGQNSAHPFENPTPFSNYLEVVGQLLLAAASVFMFGHLIQDRRQAFSLFAAMSALFLLAVGAAWFAETQAHPALGSSAWLEGKEWRFGVFNSVYFAVATTATSCGAVNAMHDSFSPIAGLLPMLNIMLGEVVFGGVGSGLYGMLLFVLLTVFISGLMVGRTPEYLGKKIEAGEMVWVIAGVLVPGFAILLGAAAACLRPEILSQLANAGPHGLSEVLYAYTSAAGNNGSAFAGFNGNTPYSNLALSAAMLVGRFGVMVPVLAVAGRLSGKRLAAPHPGTLPTHNAVFTANLIAVIIIAGALVFFPALTLGPIAEHFLMNQGRLF